MAESLKKVELKSEWLRENYKTDVVYLLSEKGSFGKVYVLDDPQDKKYPRKALKVIERFPGIKQHEWMKESIREIEILDMLKDGPSIIKLLDSNIEGNRIFLVMELAKESLNDRLVDKTTKNVSKSLDEEEILKVMKSLSESLYYAKKNMIHHRDIKPDNILIMENGDFKVSDWGGSKIVKKIGTSSQTSFIGTAIYEAPEIEDAVCGDDINLEKADIYSCGILLIECCGIDRRIFKKNKEKEGHEKGLKTTLNKNLKGDFQKELIEIIMGMCELEPKIRWELGKFEIAREILDKKYEKKNEIKKDKKWSEKIKGVKVLEVEKEKNSNFFLS